MTYVGKILVIVIMVFAILFLAFSVVVFTTEMNWKTQVDTLKVEVQNLKTQKSSLQNDVISQKSNVVGCEDELKKARTEFGTKLKDLTDQNTRRLAEVTSQRVAVEVAIQQVKKSQDEAEARIAEANILRENLQKVQLQSNEFKLQKTDLDQKILLLQKDLEVAQNNNKNLRERVTLLSGAMRKANLSDDIESLRGNVEPPPQVEGEVVNISANNQVIEISLGSNDGLKVGQEFFLYSVKPTPEYLGKVKITQTDVQQSVARVIGGKTIHGKKIQRGDHVTSKISPRG